MIDKTSIIYEINYPKKKDFFKLFESTGWNEEYHLNTDELHSSLSKSYYTVSAYDSEKLIGTNILSCHDEHSRNKFEEMLKKPTVNYYLSEKNGNKKFIYQSPWYKDGAFMGYTEFVIEIPFDIPFRKFEKE